MAPLEGEKRIQRMKKVVNKLELCFISEGHKKILLLALSFTESGEVTTSQFIKFEVTMMECNPKTVEIIVVALPTTLL